MHLLLPTDGQTHHYVLFRHLKLLVSNFRQEVLRSISRICRNCSHSCSCKKLYRRHIERGFEFEAATIKMPHGENKLFNIKKYQSKWFAQFVILFDNESLMEPADSCQNKVNYSSTQVIETHQPCGFCLLVIELDTPKPSLVKVDQSENCLERFVDGLEKLAKGFYEKKRQHRDFKSSSPLVHSSLCQLFEFTMAEIDKVLNHCPFTRKFLGYARSKCNVKRRTVYYVPILAPSSSIHDFHHICRNLTVSKRFQNESNLCDWLKKCFVLCRC